MTRSTGVWEYDAEYGEYGSSGVSVSAWCSESGQERIDNPELRYSRTPDDTPPLRPYSHTLHRTPVLPHYTPVLQIKLPIQFRGLELFLTFSPILHTFDSYRTLISRSALTDFLCCMVFGQRKSLL